MRLMYQRYSGEQGYRASDLRAAAADVVGSAAGNALDRWLARALDSTAELDYAEALNWFGLQFDPLPAKPRVSLGVGIRLDGSRTVVTAVRRGSPAAEAGIDIGDEILAVNGDAVAGKLGERLAPLAPGTKAVLTIIRRGTRQDITVTMAAEPSQLWHLSIRPNATPAQRANLEMWMFGRSAA
jgi:predicted metalloprotease with PDZ domain